MRQHAKLIEQTKHALGRWFLQCQPDLVQDTDRRDLLDHAGRKCIDDQRSRVWLDREAEPRGEAGCPNDTGRIVDE